MRKLSKQTSPGEARRFRQFARAYVNYFGGRSPILTVDGKVIVPQNEFSLDQTFHSVQSAIDYYNSRLNID